MEDATRLIGEEIEERVRSFEHHIDGIIAQAELADASMEHAHARNTCSLIADGDSIVSDARTESLTKAPSFIRSQSSFREALIDCEMELIHEDALWERFTERVQFDSNGAVKLISLDPSGKEFAALMATYAPLLAKRHSNDTAQSSLANAGIAGCATRGLRLLRAWKVAVTEDQQQQQKWQQQTTERKASRRIGKTYNSVAGIPDMMAHLQVQEQTAAKRGWASPHAGATPPLSPHATAGARRQARGDARTADRDAMIATTIEGFGLVSTVDELARSDCRSPPCSDEHEEQTDKSDRQTAPRGDEPDNRSEEAVMRAVERECGPGWFIGPRRYPVGVQRLPLFKDDVVLDNSVIKWMRTRWCDTLCDRAVYRCVTAVEGSDVATDGVVLRVASAGGRSEEGGPLSSRRVRHVEAFASGNGSQQQHRLEFEQSSIGDLLRCETAIAAIGTLSQKDREKLTAHFGAVSAGSNGGVLRGMYVLESVGGGVLCPLNDAEILELFGAYVARLSRLPSAALAFPEIPLLSASQTPCDGGCSGPVVSDVSFSHRYTFLFPALAFKSPSSSSTRPDYLLQYDVSEHPSSDDGAGVASCFLSGMCSWAGCLRTAGVRSRSVSFPLLFLCDHHADVFAMAEQRLRASSSGKRPFRKSDVLHSAPVSTFSETEAEELLTNAAAVTDSMVTVKQLLGGHLQQRFSGNRGDGGRSERLVAEIARLEEVLAQTQQRQQRDSLDVSSKAKSRSSSALSRTSTKK